MSRPTASFCLHFRGIAQFTKPSLAVLGGWLSQFDYKERQYDLKTLVRFEILQV